MNRDQKLLSQLGFSDEQSLTVKSSSSGTPSGSSESSASASSSSSSAVFNSAYALEQVLPPTVIDTPHVTASVSSRPFALTSGFLFVGEVAAWGGDGSGLQCV